MLIDSVFYLDSFTGGHDRDSAACLDLALEFQKLKQYGDSFTGAASMSLAASMLEHTWVLVAETEDLLCNGFIFRIISFA